MLSYRFGILNLVIILSLLIVPLAQAAGPVSPNSDAPAAANPASGSPRLIVELQSPSLAAWSSQTRLAREGGRLNARSTEAQTYIALLQAEQAAFVQAMQKALPGVSVASLIDERGAQVSESYQIVFNGMTVDLGKTDRAEARRRLVQLPGVKRVYLDQPHTMTLYTSTQLINAPVLWDSEEIGGRANAGAGIKIASMDGGLHKDAPMFSGAGFDYPPDFPEGGLGLQANNNGKIIASRVYFRTWDPPAPGDQNPWPGEQGTPHGNHTAGIAAGNIVTATYVNLTFPEMSGVAPGAWLMSYRVFYNSVSGDSAFYSAEGLAALEDIVADGADVVNNSWGSGPTSVGGEFDPLDMALINAAKAGVFVSMSAGNAGPGYATTDHPSADYIVVGASTTSGALGRGSFSITTTAPVAIPVALQDQPYGTAEFGARLPGVITYSLVLAEDIDPANKTACAPFEGQPLTGRAVLIRRGDCSFSAKVRNAQLGGAAMAIIYSHLDDQIITMSCADETCQDITIPSIFIGNTAGEALVGFYAANPEGAIIRIDPTRSVQIGNIPDIVASFSSRGAGVGHVLKPDIVAPGVNILSQGYADASGEARHLGFGQVSGTSMAAPHVSGAAALACQLHPDWSPAEIKSALMSTSKYLEIYNWDGSPAQPLDMGAGRLDLAAAADPGIILTPPSGSLGLVQQGDSTQLTVMLTSVADTNETYTLTTLYTGDGFDALTELPGYTVTPTVVTLGAGESEAITILFDSATSRGIGDNQGYIVMSGADHEAHMPVWARVVPGPAEQAILIIDNDGSTTLGEEQGFPDYTSYYTSTLEALGYSYTVWDADAHYGNPVTIPDATTLSGHRAIIYFTGNNFYPDGTFNVSTPLTQQDADLLSEYANSGGIIIAMGQDLSSVLGSAGDDGPTFYRAILGGSFLQDRVTGGGLPTLPIVATDDVPPAFRDLFLDLTGTGDGAANQEYIDEIAAKPFKEDGMTPAEKLAYAALLQYTGPENKANGVVAMAHREQPTLERSGISYYGRSIYTTFGLEGVNNKPGTAVTSREALLRTFLLWAFDEPTVQIVNATIPNASELMMFRADVRSNHGATGIHYRWDFGDGSGFVGPYSSDQASHQYVEGGTYTVRVEATDSYGNRAVGSEEITVGEIVTYTLFLPSVIAPSAP